jgi:hypothetical protein
MEKSMEEEPTCGKGLAEQSVLPAKLGQLMASLAENLEVHLKALDLTDENARQELLLLLQEQVEQNQKMLAEMRNPG